MCKVYSVLQPLVGPYKFKLHHYRVLASSGFNSSCRVGNFDFVVPEALSNLPDDKEALKAMVAALLDERDDLHIENLRLQVELARYKKEVVLRPTRGSSSVRG
jgi:hypothetical protein